MSRESDLRAWLKANAPHVILRANMTFRELNRLVQRESGGVPSVHRRHFTGTQGSCSVRPIELDNRRAGRIDTIERIENIDIEDRNFRS